MKQFICLIGCLMCISGFSQDINNQQKNGIDSLINRQVEAVSPGLAIGIVKDGKVVYENYKGYSNLEHQIKIDANTRFNIASNAKQFTALCILILEEKGQLKLDDDIRKYLPDLYKSIDEKISIAQLINHTSGIRDVYDLWALTGKTWWQLFVGNGDAMELIEAQKSLNFSPGSNYLYSNSNYIILTEIIKKVTEKTFSEFCSDMFSKLDINNTQFLTNYMEPIPNKASPYGNWNGWKEYPAITEIHGDGNLFSNLNDQLKWEALLQAKDGKYLPKAIVDRSQAPLPTSSLKTYGYGLMFGTYKGYDYSYHDGNTGAYNATFLRFPMQQLSIVVLSNSGSISTNYMAKQVADIVLSIDDAKLEYPAGPETIESLNNFQDIVGNYKNNDGTIIKIFEKNGELYREIYQRDPIKLINDTSGLFSYESNPDLKMNFSNINKSNQGFTIYLSSQEPNYYKKQPDFDLIEYDKTSINGTYFNDETDTEIIIKHKEGSIYTISKNGRERNAELLLKDYIRMNSYEIVPLRDSNGSVNRLSVTNGRIQDVIFKRR